MRQISFADAEYVGKNKQTRGELFLADLRRAMEVAAELDRASLSDCATRSAFLPIQVPLNFIARGSAIPKQG